MKIFFFFYNAGSSEAKIRLLEITKYLFTKTQLKAHKAAHTSIEHHDLSDCDMESQDDKITGVF